MFRPNNRGGWPRVDLRRIQERIATSFERHEMGAPRVVAIAAGEYAYDDHLYETFLELAPGVIASATFDLSDDRKEELHLARWDLIDRDLVSVGAAAADVARHYIAVGADHLADYLHDLRISVRRQLAAVTSAGGGPRLISLRLTGGDWIHPGELKVVLRIECLDRYLFAEARELLFEDVDLLDVLLHNTALPMAESYALRHALTAEGATGTIDLITLRAIERLGDVRSTLRALGRGVLPWASNQIQLFGEEGNLWSYGTDPASGLSWRASSIGHPTVIPASVLMACAGRPVTDLITHPTRTSTRRTSRSRPVSCSPRPTGRPRPSTARRSQPGRLPRPPRTPRRRSDRTWRWASTTFPSYCSAYLGTGREIIDGNVFIDTTGKMWGADTTNYAGAIVRFAYANGTLVADQHGGHGWYDFAEITANATLLAASKVGYAPGCLATDVRLTGVARPLDTLVDPIALRPVLPALKGGAVDLTLLYPDLGQYRAQRGARAAI